MLLWVRRRRWVTDRITGRYVGSCSDNTNVKKGKDRGRRRRRVPIDTKNHRRSERSNVTPVNGTLKLRDFLGSSQQLEQTSRKKNTVTLTVTRTNMSDLTFGLRLGKSKGKTR